MEIKYDSEGLRKKFLSQFEESVEYHYEMFKVCLEVIKPALDIGFKIESHGSINTDYYGFDFNIGKSIVYVGFDVHEQITIKCILNRHIIIEDSIYSYEDINHAKDYLIILLYTLKNINDSNSNTV